VRGRPGLIAGACLVGAGLVLTAARALQRCGLLGPDGLGMALGWSRRLTDRCMRAWRRGKS